MKLLSPSYEEDFFLENINTEQFFSISRMVLQKLGWTETELRENGFVAVTGMSMQSQNEEIVVENNNNIVYVSSKCTRKQFSSFGRNENNVKSFINTFKKLVSAGVLNDVQSGDLSTDSVPAEVNFPDEEPGFIGLFKPKGGYFFTPLLLILNILIFIIMILSGVHFLNPEVDDLIKWGANFEPATVKGDWWRLITACFIHIGAFHLLVNMYALAYVGSLLEPKLGSARFLPAYLLTGIAASVTSLWWNDFTVSAGASGAIFGMYGLFIALLTTNLIEKESRKEYLSSMIVFVGYNLLFGLKDGIDNAAHIGGLVSGVVLGYLFVPALKNPENKTLRMGTLALSILLVIGMSFVAFQKLPDNSLRYDEAINRFTVLEEEALTVFSLPADTPVDEIKNVIQTKGIKNWEESISLFESISDLDLPKELKEQNKLLVNYCELRMKCYHLLYRAIDEDTDQYNDSINYYNEEIAGVLSSMGIE